MQGKAVVGERSKGVGNEYFFDEPLHEPHGAFPELLQRVAAVDELIREVLVAKHRTCDQVRKQRNERREIHGMARGRGVVVVVTAGTSDIPVADEAAVTAEIMGNRVERIFDVGVAGIHRVLSRRDSLQSAQVIVCVAGMEGALPSVVGGLVSVPVIAVPTSIGYGASFGGVAALLGMLNSCASNVTVVNIDNGFGAGFVASLINRE